MLVDDFDVLPGMGLIVALLEEGISIGPGALGIESSAR